MPSKIDKLKLGSPFLDRRTKMLPCQKERVPFLREAGMTIRGIARMYGVDKRNIQFILFPERLVKNLQDRQARGGSKAYYDREYHRIKMQEHRKHKNEKLK